MGVEGEKGILGAATVSSLTRKRMDTHPLRTAADNPGRLSSAGSDLWQSLRVTISLKSEIKYWIGKPPGYLHEPSAREEVRLSAIVPPASPIRGPCPLSGVKRSQTGLNHPLFCTVCGL